MERFFKIYLKNGKVAGFVTRFDLRYLLAVGYIKDNDNFDSYILEEEYEGKLEYLRKFYLYDTIDKSC